VSTDKEEQDSSLDNQAEGIREYCEEHGYDLVDVLRERESGLKGPNDRPVMQRIVAAADDYDVLVVNSSNRLARGNRYREYLIVEFEENHDCRIESVTDKITGKSPEEDLLTTVESWNYRQSVEKRNKKIRRAYQRKKEKGHHAGPAYFGLRYNEEKTGLEKGDEFETVEEIIRRREENGESYGSIADDTGAPVSTVWRICNENRDVYERYLDGGPD